MQSVVTSLLEAFKNNKKWAAGALAVFLFFSFTDPAALAIWPEDWRPKVEIVTSSIKRAIIAFSVFWAGKNIATDTLHDKLKELQNTPGQRVLPPKELLDSDVISTIKEIKENKEISTDSKKV